MKNRKKITRLTVLGFLVIVLAMNFSGCSKESTLGPTNDEEQPGSPPALAKGMWYQNGTMNNRGTIDYGIGRYQMDLIANTYPQNAEMTLYYDQKTRGYNGGTMKVANGSQFHVNANAVIPAIYNGYNNPVTLTMVVNKLQKDNGVVLEFTFGPSGTWFSVPAEIRLDWTDLGLEWDKEPEFYYIDKLGNYIKQNPDQIDKVNRKVVLYVNHFSRYALAHAE